MYKINKELYDYIYLTIGAKYKKDPHGVQSNLENDRNKNLEYLGTYFPRSYVESYRIFCNVFDCFFNYDFKFGNTINILDVGSGTGGQLFGLLQALYEKSVHVKVNIFSVDGNKDALNIQKDIFDKQIKCRYGGRIKLYIYNERYNNKEDFIRHIKSKFYEINIMLSFKFLSEMVGTNEGIYTETLEIAENILSSDGILCLVDTTNEVKKNDGQNLYIPFISNKEVFAYFREKQNTRLHYFLPSCCAKNIDKCPRDKCFVSYTVPVKYNASEREHKEKIHHKLFMKRGTFSNRFRGSYHVHCHSQCIETKTNLCHCKTTCLLEAHETPLRDCNFEDSPFAFKII